MPKRKQTNLTKGWSFVFPLLILFSFLTSLSHAGTFTAYGPKAFQRGTGNPVIETDSFSVLNPNTSYTINADNGGLVDNIITGELVSSGEIKLNGALVIGPQNFNQNVSLISEPVTLQTVNNLSVDLRGKPGGVVVIDIVGIDNDPPSITASVDIPTNATGWNNTSVTVSFDCSDAISGIQTCPAPITVNIEGANQVITGTAVDLAGNTASTSVTLNIDKTAPVITSSASPSANAAGWNNTDVSVAFTCTDNLSGISSCSDAFTLATEGANQVISGTAIDVAGNSATDTVSISIDKKPPNVAILSPEHLASLTGSPITITGSVDDTGAILNVNGILTSINPDGTFSVDGIELIEGPNILTASAIDLADNEGTFSIEVILGINIPLELTSNITSGVPPLTINYLLETDIPAPIVSYNLDFDGDGIFDYSKGHANNVSFTYNTEGIFSVTATVIDDQNNSFSDTITIDILSREVMDALLTSIWNDASDSLRNKDILNALSYFVEENQAKYEQGFLLLEDQLPEIFSMPEEFNLISVIDNIAIYENVVNEEGVTRSYPVTFVKDENGFWKIRSF